MIVQVILSEAKNLKILSKLNAQILRLVSLRLRMSIGF
jgi:hypothetical protein